MLIATNQTHRKSAATSAMQLKEGTTQLHRFSEKAPHTLRLFTMCLLTLTLILPGCALLQQSKGILDIVQQALGSRGTLKTEVSADSVTVIRTFPTTICKLKVRHDSTYNLLSGDRLHIAWLNDTSAVIVAEIASDTVTIPLPK